MGWMNNLKVAYKLLILVVVAVIGMSFIGWNGYSAVTKAHRDMEVMFEGTVRGIDAVGQARYGTRYAQGMAVIATTVKDNNKRLQELKGKYEDGTKSVDENLAKYRRPGKSLSSNKLEALRRIWNLYRKAEGMSIPDSLWHFCFWAVRAVKRRV